MNKPLRIDGLARCLLELDLRARPKNVAVMGGPDIGRQFIEAGLVDKLGVHFVPVLFGSGTRMFEHFGSEHIQLETTSVIETPLAIHMRFRVVEQQWLRKRLDVGAAGNALGGRRARRGLPILYSPKLLEGAFSEARIAPVRCPRRSEGCEKVFSSL